MVGSTSIRLDGASLRISASLLMCLCLGQIGRAQVSDSKAPDDEEPLPRTDWSEVIRKSADEYKLFMDDDRRKPLNLQKKPVLRWGNITRHTADGYTYLWIADGRPEAVSCIYMRRQQTIWHCFGSLSRGRLVGERNDQRVWYPQQPGVTFQAVPDAPVPANTAKARIRQMKAFTRRFSAVLIGPGGDLSMNDPLRLLPRELYRYESQDPDLLDGALFAFVEGTDPESLLLLEAVRVESAFVWQYALARRTSGAVEVQYQGKTVSKTVVSYPARDPEETYIELPYAVDLGDLR